MLIFFVVTKISCKIIVKLKVTPEGGDTPGAHPRLSPWPPWTVSDSCLQFPRADQPLASHFHLWNGRSVSFYPVLMDSSDECMGVRVRRQAVTWAVILFCDFSSSASISKVRGDGVAILPASPAVVKRSLFTSRGSFWITHSCDQILWSDQRLAF